VSSIQITDAASVSRNVAARDLAGAGVFYQMTEPEASTHHRVSAGSGDAVNIASAPAVLKAVRVFNKGAVPVYVKFHNTAGTPTPGAGVVFAVPCQAGLGNPDPRLSGGGRAFSTGIGMSIVTDLADAGSNAVGAGDVLVEVEYHGA
jgi:hypothetical protein